MPRVRQLPEIYLRGALANETMKHLDPSQLESVDKIVNDVANHPILSGHKNMFVTQLANTIACDYADDRACALQDYHIAIWRATVHLMYHSPYSYLCMACNSNTYVSTQGKEIAINRRVSICPNCKCVQVADSGGSEYTVGQMVLADEFDTVVDDCIISNVQRPTSTTPIMAIAENQKVADPYKVLNDPDQLKRFYGQFIWNYFRQIIRENSITTHGKQNIRKIGPADYLLTMAIASILRDHSVEYNYEPAENPSDGYYRIYCNPYTTPYDVTAKIQRLMIEADCFSTINIEFDENGIRVQDMKADAPLVELEVSHNDPVFIVWAASNDDSGEPIQMIDQVAQEDMYQDSSCFDDNDQMSALRESLPSGDCQTVMELLSGHGRTYDRFVEEYPTGSIDKLGVPRLNKIASFIGCSVKDVKKHQQTIKHALLATV